MKKSTTTNPSGKLLNKSLSCQMCYMCARRRQKSEISISPQYYQIRLHHIHFAGFVTVAKNLICSQSQTNYAPSIVRFIRRNPRLCRAVLFITLRLAIMSGAALLFKAMQARCLEANTDYIRSWDCETLANYSWYSTSCKFDNYV